jgi:peptidyl-prolyl cis-trans isomerase B (cyclophilin B)
VKPVLAALAAALALLAWAGCGEEEKPEQPAAEAPPATQATVPGCKQVEAPQPRDDAASKPKGPLDPKRDHTVTFTTSCGKFSVKLDVKRAPKTTASFASLVRQKFFDDTLVTRIVPGFVIQAGDPTGSGDGDPGYSTVEPPPADTVYSKGVVAMAKTGQDPAGHAGSQFYVVTGDGVQLPPEYALLGKVSKGQEVADRIGQLGDPQSGDQGTPLVPVVIEKARVK